MLEIVNFPELCGHTIGATTGLPPGYTEIGTPCGELPDDWDAARHGRHYCLAAPERSTSTAVAYISATLANMMAASRRQVGSLEIVRRLMNTADQTGKFSDSLLYGAGLVDPQAALQAVGRTVTGTSGGEAPVRQTRSAWASSWFLFNEARTPDTPTRLPRTGRAPRGAFASDAGWPFLPGPSPQASRAPCAAVIPLVVVPPVLGGDELAVFIVEAPPRVLHGHLGRQHEPLSQYLGAGQPTVGILGRSLGDDGHAG